MTGYVFQQLGLCFRSPSTTDTLITCLKNSFAKFWQLFSPKLEDLLYIWVRGWPYLVSSCSAFRSHSATVAVHHCHHIFLFWFPALSWPISSLYWV